MHFSIPVHPTFRLRSVIMSHGWCDLAPFSTNEAMDHLTFAFASAKGGGTRVELRQSGRSLQVDCDDMADRVDVERVTRDVVRIDHDLSDFHRMVRRHQELRWISRLGAGRILRAPSAFEDTVKMIYTTNCSWSLTKSMTTRLCEELGRRAGDRRAFPTPHAMARKKESFYRNIIKAGYRSPFLVELSQRVADGEIDLELLRHPAATRSTKEAVLEQVKGVGPYASDNILRLHEVYDTFAHDSWIRPEYARRYHEGRRVSDRTIEKRYAEFGEWKGLVYWMDMTKKWYGVDSRQ